jgi:hypothetical protein
MHYVFYGSSIVQSLGPLLIHKFGRHKAFFASNRAFRRAATSLAANCWLALTIWATFRYCFSSMTGAEMTANTQGIVESILLARAISIAPALHGLGRMLVGTFGEPGWIEVASPVGAKSDGERYGDENDNRYNAMKKSSFSAQTVNRTVRFV